MAVFAYEDWSSYSTNEDLGSPDWGIVRPVASDVARVNADKRVRGSYGQATRIWSSPAPSDDQVVETTIYAATQNHEATVGPVARAGVDACYFLWLNYHNTSKLRLGIAKVDYTTTAGRGDTIIDEHVADTVTPGHFHSLRLEVEGDELRGYLDNVLVLQTVDDEPLSGKGVGLSVRSGGGGSAGFQIADWQASTLGDTPSKRRTLPLLLRPY